MMRNNSICYGLFYLFFVCNTNLVPWGLSPTQLVIEEVGGKRDRERIKGEEKERNMESGVEIWMIRKEKKERVRYRETE